MSLPWKIRAVQLDLARQMETVDFICRFADFIASHGFNTLVLYLEGRVQTPSFPFRPADASYSLDDMDRVVRHARAAGIDVVPVISVLGHAEQFVSCPELAHLAEERDGRSRFGGTGVSTFCPSLPATYEFLARYLREVIQVFPSPHLHLGFDEAWNLGYCRVCAERWQREGLGKLFGQHVRRMWELCNHLGKRMWMWDDLYEFWPDELNHAPRDIVMCHWNYDPVVHPEGSQAHFRNRWRKDWLAEYERQGLEAIVAPVHSFQNCLSLTDYARRHAVSGALLTQWEMQTVFHAGYAPVIAAVGKLWNSPSFDPATALDQGVRAVLPGAGEDIVKAVKGMIRIGADTRASSLSQQYWRGPLAQTERMECDALQVGLDFLQQVRKSAPAPDNNDILNELEHTARETLVGWTLRELAPASYDPRRLAEDTPRLQAAARHGRAEIEALIPIRERQHAQLRPGCHPANMAADHLRKALALVDEILSRLERMPRSDERWVVLRLCLPDAYGSPRLRVSALWGETVRELASRSFKPPLQAEGSHYTVRIPFTSETPPDAIRLESWGYGGQGVSYLEVQDRTRRQGPAHIRSASGPVRDADALLRDDSLFTWFGHADILTALHHPELAEEQSCLEIELVP